MNQADIGARYALRSAEGFWSNGNGPWKREIPKTLLDGATVDALAKRFPNDAIVDVVVYCEILTTYERGVRSVIPADFPGCSTPEMRAAARSAGKAALVAAGFAPDAHIL